ncbi:hypothetical protein L861_04835 [Litchfieldella anticariensis FP35 = DSM 16096]|uniref:Uncharacterized protein n=1 Tax=Litchfieldella anticariensis (strain DSM 16096 / CECT 5854 / CIP 108499 / LMG 22089 / FP35) TaxID=1121939 RepID=S2L668_LITA3|nr:hypothetical protein [Halomonas anticariensis]EPC03259.1 hypothetical protein L861_04835 [Halomonas anticariensis FP35 = DSM 16096]
MLISDSMPLLWLVYVLLSLVVLATGYMSIRFLPLLPRLMVTGVVAGALWMPARFSLPLLEEGEFYTGLAPAVVVAGVAFLQRDGGAFGTALTLLVIAMVIGAMTGAALWWLWRRRGEPDESKKEERAPRRSNQPASGNKRREPVIG